MILFILIIPLNAANITPCPEAQKIQTVSVSKICPDESMEYINTVLDYTRDAGLKIHYDF